MKERSFIVSFPETCDKTATDVIIEFLDSLSEEAASGFVTVFDNSNEDYTVGVYDKAADPRFRCNSSFSDLWDSNVDRVRYIIREDHISLDIYVNRKVSPPTVEDRVDELTRRIDKLETELKMGNLIRQVIKLNARLGKED